jgi:hypothetical protein
MSEKKLKAILDALYSASTGLIGLREYLDALHKQFEGNDDSPGSPLAAVLSPNVHLIGVAIDALEAELPEEERP